MHRISVVLFWSDSDTFLLFPGSNIDHHIHSIVKILLEEEDGVRGTVSETGGALECSTTDCLEYVLQERVFETLCLLAVKDEPKGLRKLVLLAVSTLLKGISRPILQHVSVHHSINRLLAAVTDTAAVNTHEYLSLLVTICRMCSSQTYMLKFLVSEDMEFPLFQGLRRRLAVTQMNEDASRRAVIQLVRAASEESKYEMATVKCITSCGFGNEVAEGLANDFKEVVAAAGRAKVIVELGGEAGNQDMREKRDGGTIDVHEAPTSVQSLPEYEDFANRFRFLIALVSVSCPAILDHLLHELAHTFLNSVFISAFLNPAITPVHVATVVLRNIVRELQMVASDSEYEESRRVTMLSHTLQTLLLGTSPYVLPDLHPPSQPQVQTLVFSTLLQRISSPTLATCTLKLWLSLLLLHDSHVAYVLLWKNFLQSPPLLSYSLTLQDISPEPSSSSTSSSSSAYSLHLSASTPTLPSEVDESKARIELSKIVTQQLMSLYERVCRALGQQNTPAETSSAYDDYLEDSFALLGETANTYKWNDVIALYNHTHSGKEGDEVSVNATLSSTSSASAPLTNSHTDSSHESKRDVNAYSGAVEGPFLGALLNKVGELTSCQMEEVLMLTSIFSTLLHIPNPSLHCLLLHPMKPVSSENDSTSAVGTVNNMAWSSSLIQRSLLSLLQDAVNQIELQAGAVADIRSLTNLVQRWIDEPMSGKQEGKGIQLPATGVEWLKCALILKEFLLEIVGCVQAKASLMM